MGKGEWGFNGVETAVNARPIPFAAVNRVYRADRPAKIRMPADPDGKVRVCHLIMGEAIVPADFPLELTTDLKRSFRDLAIGSSKLQEAILGGTAIYQPTDIGFRAAFFEDFAGPVELAAYIAKELKFRFRFDGRFGINSGPLTVTEERGGLLMAGDGINYAQRAMSLGDAGHILLTEPFATWIRSIECWRHQVHMLGPVIVKNGVQLTVSSLHSPTYGQSERPVKLGPPIPGYHGPMS